MKPVVEILRREETDRGTIGVLSVNKKVIGFTLEEADRLNKQNVSSIPAQQYTMKRRWSNRFKLETFEVKNVTGRSAILFHPGNTDADTEGCILPGLEVGSPFSLPRVRQSRGCFERFMKVLEGHDEATLTIVEHYG